METQTLKSPSRNLPVRRLERSFLLWTFLTALAMVSPAQTREARNGGSGSRMENHQ